MPTVIQRLVRKLFDDGIVDRTANMVIGRDYTYAFWFSKPDHIKTIEADIEQPLSEKAAKIPDIFSKYKITGAEFEIKRLKRIIDYMEKTGETEVQMFMCSEPDYPLKIDGKTRKVSVLLAPRVAYDEAGPDTVAYKVTNHNASFEKKKNVEQEKKLGAKATVKK